MEPMKVWESSEHALFLLVTVSQFNKLQPPSIIHVEHLSHKLRRVLLVSPRHTNAHLIKDDHVRKGAFDEIYCCLQPASVPHVLGR